MKIALIVAGFVLLVVLLLVAIVLWKANQVPKGPYSVTGYAASVASRSAP